jgi:hypothetical protein
LVNKIEPFVGFIQEEEEVQNESTEWYS